MPTAAEKNGSWFFSVALVLLVLFLLWLALSVVGATRKLETEIANAVPAWIVLANLATAPCLGALAAGALPISRLARLIAIALTLLSAVLLEICFRRFPWPSATVVMFLLLEAYWIVPKWNARHRRSLAEKS